MGGSRRQVLPGRQGLPRLRAALRPRAGLDRRGTYDPSWGLEKAGTRNCVRLQKIAFRTLKRDRLILRTPWLGFGAVCCLILLFEAWCGIALSQEEAAQATFVDSGRQAAGSLKFISSSFGRTLAADDMPVLSPGGVRRKPRREPKAFQLAQPIEPEAVFRPAPAPQIESRVPLEKSFVGASALSMIGTESIEDAGRRAYAQTIEPVAGVTTLPNLSITARPDLGQALAENNLALQAQWRTSTTQAPFIRGFKNQQIYDQVDGQFFWPVRQDLDTVINKIDPGTVQNVIVINGPYSVRYGPGFSFIDIATAGTPRNQQAQYRTSTSWIENGQQWYGRETVSAGAQNLGFRLSYGHRNGNDYRAGNDQQIESHYNNGDILAELGYDLSNSQRVELSYRRLDQNHTAYPGQFFDIAALETNAFNLRYIDEDVTKPWTRLIAQGWYNKSNMTGNTFNPNHQPTVNAVEQSLTSFYTNQELLTGNPAQTFLTGFSSGTVGDVTSTGGRVSAQFGEMDEVSLLTGVDARVINQRVSEYFTLANAFDVAAQSYTPITNYSSGMPRATMVNPGAFAEATLPWTDDFRTKIGARGDYVGTNANPNTLPANPGSVYVIGNTILGPGLAPGLPNPGAMSAALPQQNGLYSFYLLNQLQVTEHWDFTFSGGQAQRPPSLIDRYADQMLLGIMQSGFRQVIGSPNLSPERNWQIDAVVNGKYENWRGYLRGYNSWVTNYITYAQVVGPGTTLSSGTGFDVLNTINTPLAELRGFEAFNSIDVAPRITPFAAAHYVYGMDQTIHQPLPQIPPLQAFAGIRFHDPNGGNTWGLETFATITREQNRPGVIRNDSASSPLVQIEQRTGGWTTYNLRGYWNVSPRLMLAGGINNLFNKTYIEHLSLRTGPVLVLSPGFSPYLSAEWTY